MFFALSVFVLYCGLLFVLRVCLFFVCGFWRGVTFGFVVGVSFFYFGFFVGTFNCAA